MRFVIHDTLPFFICYLCYQYEILLKKKKKLNYEYFQILRYTSYVIGLGVRKSSTNLFTFSNENIHFQQYTCIFLLNLTIHPHALYDLISLLPQSKQPSPKTTKGIIKIAAMVRNTRLYYDIDTDDIHTKGNIYS